MRLRVLVLGEGQDEEGEYYYSPLNPGCAVPDELMGAAHVIVKRSIVELIGVPDPELVFMPKLRSRRRPGNGGLLADLEGRPRIPSERRRKGWFELAVGRNSIDLGVVIKDAGSLDRVEFIRGEIVSGIAGRRPGRLAVIPGVATPSIEGWLLMVPESDALNEADAKERWDEAGYGSDPATKAGVAWSLDLHELQSVCPVGFGRLVADLRAALARLIV